MALFSTLRPERGFHFEYSTTLSLDGPKQGCAAYLLYVLPPAVFVDKYELKQRPVSFTLHGHADLELPLAAVDNVPSVLEIRIPPEHVGEITVDIPLHARYPRPSSSPYSIVRVSEPQAFWACPSTNPSPPQDAAFTHIHTQYTPSFDLNAWSITFFDTQSRERYHEIQVPAGTPAHAQAVEFGTIFVVVAAFLYVARAIWKASAHLRQEALHIKHE